MSSRPRRTVSISSHDVFLVGCRLQSTRFSLTLMTISRSPLIHARWIQRQYVPSYVRLVALHDVRSG